MHLTPTIEQTIIDFIYDKAKVVIPATFKRPFYFASRQDFAARANQTFTDFMEVSFLQIRFRGYDDETTLVGCDDPTTILHYRLSLFESYKAARSNDTDSRQTITSDIIRLRSAFNTNQVIIANVAQHTELKPIGAMIENEETKFLTGVKGDLMEWNLDVEVT